MKTQLKGTFGIKAGELTNETIEAQVSKLPEHTQLKYKELIKSQQARYREFEENLDKDREKLLIHKTSEELIRLSAPRLQPANCKRSKKDLAAEAKIEAQKQVSKLENERRERMKSLHFSERIVFVDNAQKREKDSLSRTFKEHGRNTEGQARNFSQ